MIFALALNNNQIKCRPTSTPIQKPIWPLGVTTGYTQQKEGLWRHLFCFTTVEQGPNMYLTLRLIGEQP